MRGVGIAPRMLKLFTRCFNLGEVASGRGQFKCGGTRTETRFRLSAKRSSPFKSAVASVQSTTGSQVVRISGSNAGYTMFRGSVKGTVYPLQQFPLHFPSLRHRVPSHFNLLERTGFFLRASPWHYRREMLIPARMEPRFLGRLDDGVVSILTEFSMLDSVVSYVLNWLMLWSIGRILATF